MAKQNEENPDKEGQEDEDMDTDSSSDDSDEDTNVEDAKIRELQERVDETPYSYDGHIELINALKKAGDLENLRRARQKMSEIFPLTPELWLAWLGDEIKLEESRDHIYELFDRAVKDYTSVDLWLEYFQYSVGDVAKEGGVKRIRYVAERALTAVGKHVAEGSLIWDAYRELENAVLAGLQPAPGSVASAQLVEQQQEQTKRIHTLFKRQLAVPLLEMESTWNEYSEWSEEEIDNHTKHAYDRALKQLQALMPYEEELMSAEGTKLDAYKKYLKHELKENQDPSRIQCLFERALVHNCLVPDVWERYGKYLDEILRVRTVVLSVYERAVRNCPWHVTLWLRYCRALERHCPDEHECIVGVFEKALSSDNFSQSNDFLQMWTAYIDYMRRRVQFNEEHEKELADLRETFQRAIDYLHQNFENDGDPNCSIQQYWARIEAKFCKNMEKARDLWNSVMQRGFGNQAQMWLEYFNLERAYGDHKHCRKILGRALNSVADWPEYIVDAYIMYEREEGTLEQLDQATERCDAQMKRIEERKAAAAEKEARLEERKKKQPKEFQQRKPQRQFVSGGQLGGTKQPKAETMSPVKTDSDGFAVPAVPSALPPPSARSPVKRPPPSDEQQPVNQKRPNVSKAPPPGYRGPPPGYAERHASEDAPPTKKQRVEEESSVMSDQTQGDAQDAAKNARTVFISNLDYNKKEADLLHLLSRAGKVKDIRLVKAAKGRNKGFGYVEYEDEFSASEALNLDRTEIEGRAMYVSKCAEKKKDRHQFQYDTEMEKNKLFVRGLPFSTNKEALHTLFSQYGTVKEVRMVTYKNGAPKGLAYVEYEKEEDAAKAVMKADGLTMGEHQISVAISNPPRRRTPLEQRQAEKPTLTPSLGSGKKDVNRAEKPRTLLAFQPRALKTKAPVRGPAKTDTETSQSASQNEATGESKSDKSVESKPGLSNAQFRDMLFKKTASETRKDS